MKKKIKGYMVYYKNNGERKTHFFSDLGNALERSENNNGKYITYILDSK